MFTMRAEKQDALVCRRLRKRSRIGAGAAGPPKCREGPHGCTKGTNASGHLSKAQSGNELNVPLRIVVRNRCKRPRCASNPGPGSVTPAQRVKEFPKEELKVSAGKVFCNACREELSTKKSTIENHVGSSKHTAGKKKACKQGAEGTGHSRCI